MKSSRRFTQPWQASVLAVLFTSLSIAAFPPATAAQWPATTVQSENDAYPSWGDDDYTNGLRVSFDFQRALWWSPFSERYEDCRDAQPFDDSPCRRTTLMLGQNFYSPRDITVSEVQENERPYSAWLYVGAAARLAEYRRLRSVELHLGTTGRAALGKEVQTWWHGLGFIDAPEPKGWAHQVRPVPGRVGVVAIWDEKMAREKSTRGSKSWVYADVMPYYRLTGGNVHTNAAAGATFRAGYNLTRRWGEKMNPTALVASVVPVQIPQNQRNLELGGFFSVEGRAVAWNALLQHDTYTPRELLPIERGVIDLEAGVAVRYKRVSGGFRWVWRSPEFATGRWSRYAGWFLTVEPSRRGNGSPTNARRTVTDDEAFVVRAR